MSARPEPAAEPPGIAPSCVLAEIHRIGWSRLTDLQAVDEIFWWIELDDVLLACGTETATARVVGASGLAADLGSLALAEIWVAEGFHRRELADLDLELLVVRGGVALFRHSGIAASSEILRRGSKGDNEAHRGSLRPAEADTILLRQAANQPPRGRAVFAPEVQGLVDLVDDSRWFADVEDLASFNRYTHNEGIYAARDWLVAELSRLPGLLITTPSFSAQGSTAYNVVATLPGLIRPDDWYIIGAHYDAMSEDPQEAAPGAEDNASGCAGVLEMARIFTAYRPDATVLFICYSAEELGLLGSKDHVQDLIAAGDLDKIEVMLNLDMIGYTSDTDLDCLLETEPFAAGLLDTFTDAAAQFTTLRIVTDVDACCSDHKPYLNNGVPALLTIELDYFEYPHYHRTTDLPVHLDLDMAREILKMNVAAMAQLIGAPDPPVFTDGFESGDTSLWWLTIP